MFPGVVHERTRRGSLRQGSNSEKDANATNFNVATAPTPLPWEQDDKGLQKAVIEEPGEQRNRDRPQDSREHERDTRRGGVEW